MPGRRRWVLALSVLLVVGSTAGAPVASAAPRAPKFDVTTNVDRVSGYWNRVFLRFRFVSTNPDRQAGFARLVIPVQTFTKNNQQLSATWGPPLQTTDATEDGYLAVQQGSCAVAKLNAFTSANVIQKSTIDVKFDCKLGKSFSINWYPEGRWYNMDGTSASDEDWAFPIRTRFTRRDRWTNRRAPVVTVAASPVFITVPNLWLDEPKQVVAATQEFDPVLGTPTLLVVGTTQLTDVTRIAMTLGLANGRREDTGELVTVADPELLRVQQTIQISSCVPGEGYDCASAPLGVVTIREPVDGTFGDPNTGELLTGQVAVIYGVSFAQASTSGFDETEDVCRSYGGLFSRSDGAIDGNYWSCVFPPPSTPAQAEAFAAAGEAGITALRTSAKALCPNYLIVDRTHAQYYARVNCKR